MWCEAQQTAEVATALHKPMKIQTICLTNRALQFIIFDFVPSSLVTCSLGKPSMYIVGEEIIIGIRSVYTVAHTQVDILSSFSTKLQQLNRWDGGLELVLSFFSMHTFHQFYVILYLLHPHQLPVTSLTEWQWTQSSDSSRLCARGSLHRSSHTDRENSEHFF